MFIVRSIGLSYQEVVIALVGKQRQNFSLLRNYAVLLGSVVTVLIALIAFTPLADMWFTGFSGLDRELAGLSYLPLRIMILLPALTVLLNFQRSLFVVNGTTGPISAATAIELIGIIAVLLVCVIFLDMVGVVAASIAFVAGKGMSTLYLLPGQNAIVKRWRVQAFC